MNEIQIAIDNNYYIKVENIQNTIGCKVYFPNNKILKIPSVMYFYTYENGLLNLLNNSFEIISSIECPEFAVSAISIFDIMIKASKLQIKPPLIICFKNNEMIGDYRKYKSIINTEEKFIPIEAKLIDALQNLHDDTYEISKDIADIYNNVKTKISLDGDILC